MLCDMTENNRQKTTNDVSKFSKAEIKDRRFL